MNGRLARGWMACLAPALVSLIFRVWCGAAWWDSPFRWYHRIQGLDLRTHVAQVGAFIQGGGRFSLYSLLSAPGYLLGGADGMVLAQLLFGVFTPALVAFAALRIYRHFLPALAAGMLAAVYAPAVMYDFFQLKESFQLFAGALSLALAAHAWRRGFPRGWTILAGATAALPSQIRISGALWAALAWGWIAWRGGGGWRGIRGGGGRRTAGTSVMRAGLGILAVLALATAFNLANGNWHAPFGSGLNFSFYLRGEVAPKAVAVVGDTAGEPAGGGAETAGAATVAADNSPALKLWRLFLTVESANNLNYYFIRANLPPLGWLVDPMFLLPLAYAGAVLLCWRRQPRGGASLTLLYFAAHALPMLLYQPLARYRLSMLPVFAIWGAYPVFWTLLRSRRLPKRWRRCLAAAVCLALSMAVFIPRRDPPARVHDFLAYVAAMEHAGASAAETAAVLERTVQLYPESPLPAERLSHLWMGVGDFAAARRLLRSHPAMAAATPNQRLLLAYTSALMGCGDIAAAAEILESMPPSNSVDYFYQLGESRRLRGLRDGAAAAYRAGLQATADPRQRQFFTESLRGIGEPPEDDEANSAATE